MTIPLAPVMGLGAGISNGLPALMAGDFEGAVKAWTWAYTGYSIDRNKFEIEGLTRGVLPLVLGLLVHKFVGGPPLNLNKTLANARVPFLRI